jgi:hypothetical protein
MISCPNCSNANMVGAAFCEECGVTLLSAETLTTQKIDFEQHTDSERRRPTAPRAPAPDDNWVTLHLLESGQVLPLAERNEFTIGRISDGQPVMPDIDLTPYQAFGHGVSRLHAVIRRGVDAILLTDLESANGTFVNGRRLEPNEERPLANGDIVSLGGLKIQVLLNPR